MKYIYTIILVLIVWSCGSNKVADGFEIFGNASEPYQNTTLVLATESFADTCIVKDGKFYFKGVVDRPTYAYIIDKYHNSNYRSFWLENNRIEFIEKDKTFVRSKIIGSKTQLEARVLQDRLKIFIDERNKAFRSFLNSNFKESKRDSINQFIKELEDSMTTIRQNYVLEFPNSLVSLYQLDFLKAQWGKNKTAALFYLMNRKSKRSKYGKSIYSFILTDTLSTDN